MDVGPSDRYEGCWHGTGEGRGGRWGRRALAGGGGGGRAGPGGGGERNGQRHDEAWALGRAGDAEGRRGLQAGRPGDSEPALDLNRPVKGHGGGDLVGRRRRQELLDGRLVVGRLVQK